MITMIGTGHVFRIAEPVAFVIKNMWPKAVCLELDDRRYVAMTEQGNRPISESPKGLYRKTAQYQNKVSEKNKTTAGGEMLAAIGAAKRAGAEIICIDVDAEKAINEMWEEMSGLERMRYRMSGIADRIFMKHRADSVQKEYSEHEEEYLDNMRKRYPTLVRKLIDERNDYMAKQIREVCAQYDDVVIVVGDGHIPGLRKRLSNIDMNVIRLAELLDPEKVKKVYDAAWNGSKSE